MRSIFISVLLLFSASTFADPLREQDREMFKGVVGREPTSGELRLMGELGEQEDAPAKAQWGYGDMRRIRSMKRMLGEPVYRDPNYVFPEDYMHHQ